MKVTFLEAKVPLTKTFRRAEDGSIDKDGHPKIVPYLSHHYELSHSDLGELYEKLCFHASKGHCWQKGNATEKLDWAGRAGKTDPNEPSRVLLLDLDGVKDFVDAPSFLRSLELGEPDYVIQYSSSMGVLKDKGLSAHIFVLLDREHTPGEMKDWLRHKNFAVPSLLSGIRLSKNGNALRWTLDVTTCQSDKLIYIAPPICEGDVTDDFKGERIQLVRQKTKVAKLAQIGYSPESNSQRTQAKMDELRVLAGLKEKPWDKTREERGESYMPNPGVATMSGKRDRGDYVSLNLNGGDSWGYWHPKQDPYFLYNFKGEPVFRLKDILPDYWASLRRAHQREVGQSGIEYLAFRDIKRSRYYNGTYDRAKDVLELFEADSEGQLFSYLEEHGQPLPKVIPTWKVEYDPHNPRRVDSVAKWLNLYQPSEYERRWAVEPRKVEEVPALVKKFMHHALGGSDECYEHFLNWCAYVVQSKRMAKTAWLLHGVEGTGKGFIFDQLLRPALGSNAMVTNLENFEGQFNGFLENKILVLVDEAQMSAHATAKVLEGKFRQIITEPFAPIRHMRRMMYEAPSYVSVLIFSNKGGAVNVQDSDRRYNIAPYQDKPLSPAPGEYDAAAAQSWDFYCYLRTRTADQYRAEHALVNEAKSQVAAATRTSVDEVAKEWLAGNYEYFSGNVRDTADGLTRPEQDIATAYKEIVGKMRAWKYIHRDELCVVFQYLVGQGVPSSPAKFTKYLSFHRLAVEPGCRREGRDAAFRGVKTHWEDA